MKFKEEAEPLLGNYEREIHYADSLMDIMRQRNAGYQSTIFELKSINESKDIRLSNGNEKMEITKESFKMQLKAEEGKKWNWGAYGIIIGGLIGFLTAMSL